MAHPTPQPQRRSSLLTIPVSAMEMIAIKQAAKSQDLPMAAWARTILLKSLMTAVEL